MDKLVSVVYTHNRGNCSTKRDDNVSFCGKCLLIGNNIEAYKPPVINTSITPSFLPSDSFKLQTAGIGRIKRVKSTTTLMKPVGTAKL